MTKEYMKTITVEESGLHIVLWIFSDGTIRLVHFSAAEFEKEKIESDKIKEGFPLIGLSISGYDRPYERHGNIKEIVGRQDENLHLWIPHNSWQREMNWKEYSLSNLGMDLTQKKEIQRSSSMIRVTNTGNWSQRLELQKMVLKKQWLH